MDSCDDATIITSNRSQLTLSPFVATPATAHTPSKFKIALTHAIADTGATSIYIMEGTEVANRRKAPSPLTINLADGIQVQSSDVCDFHIPGLPVLLTGHIVPALNVASSLEFAPFAKRDALSHLMMLNVMSHTMAELFYAVSRTATLIYGHYQSRHLPRLLAKEMLQRCIPSPT